MASWCRPDPGFLKLNVKGVLGTEEFAASVGCVIRDSHGRWKKGCAGVIGFAPPLLAELLALFHGLQTAWEMSVRGEKKFVVEIDAVVALDVVLNTPPNFLFQKLVDDINIILRQPWDALELRLIDPTANEAAKTFALHALGFAEGIEDYHSPPAPVYSVVQNEA